MNCDSVTKLIPLYFYGEVAPDEEEQVDQHLHECAPCAARMEQQRTLAAALDRRQTELPPALLDVLVKAKKYTGRGQRPSTVV